MPQSVSKGSILKRLDALSQNRDSLKALLDSLLQQGENSDIVAIGTQHGVLATDEERTHMRQDWFTNWWPRSQPVQPIVARGLITAVEEALDRGVPLDSYWVCTTGHNEPAPHEGDLHVTGEHPPTGQDGVVEVNVVWSDRQVTVMLHTPGGGRNSIPDVPATIPEPIKTIARTPNGIKVIQPKHRP